jgi:hypothetical protein
MEKNEPIGMECEYGNCNRSGRDYIRPNHLHNHDGWDDEPFYLCEYHAKELKVSEFACQYRNSSGRFGIDFVKACRFYGRKGKMKIL